MNRHPLAHRPVGSAPVRLLLAAMTFLMVALVVQNGHAQEDREYTVALFAPDVLFPDAVSKANFIQSVAQAVAGRTGLKVKGQSFARAEDFKARKADYAVIGGTYYASAGGGKVVAFAAGDPPMALIGQAGASSNVALLKGKTLILPRSGNLLEGWVTATVLDHEARAKDFFKIIYSKDVQSALAAVKLGQADATVAFAPYAAQSGLSILYNGPAGPLPVVVQVNDKLEPEVASKLEAAFGGLSVGGGGIVTGFGGGGKGLKSFRGFAVSRPQVKRPIMTDDRVVQVNFELVTAEGETVWERTGPEDIVPLPPLPE